jgi:hypothetical protein
VFCWRSPHLLAIDSGSDHRANKNYWTRKARPISFIVQRVMADLRAAITLWGLSTKYYQANAIAYIIKVEIAGFREYP